MTYYRKICIICGESLSYWEGSVCSACTERELTAARKAIQSCTVCKRPLNRQELKTGKKKCKKCRS